MWPQAKGHSSYQKLGQARKDPPLEPLDQRGLPHLEFPLLALEVAENLSLVLSHPVCGHLVWQP